MWYEGNDGLVRQLGYATSTNGIDWQKYAGNPVLPAGPEPYDADAAAHGSVLDDGGTYKLWYHAAGDEGAIVAYATSPDGVHWTKQGPVLHPEAGAWDESALWSPSVLQLGGTFWMWYSAFGPQGAAIGVVTSTNGVTWTRFLTAPVLTAPAGIGDPHVISGNGKLMMWYSDYEHGAINYAESTDGIVWTPSPANPVFWPGTLAAQWGRPVFQIDAAGVVLDGLTIQGGDSQEAGGVRGGPGTVIRRCVIRDNTADGWPYFWGGGGVVSSEPLSILDSVIVGNRVVQGAGGVRTGPSPLTMVNTIVAENHGQGGGIHANSAVTLWHVTVTGNDGGMTFNPQAGETLLMTNSIFYGNVGWTLETSGAAVQVTYSDVEGGLAGTGNIDADPLFADPAAHDYHLLGGSPAIDAGTNTGAPPADFEGDPRPLDGDLDGTLVVVMGADEFRPYVIFMPVSLWNAGP